MRIVPRSVTIFLCVLLFAAVALRFYFSTREEFRFVQEFLPFTLTNDVATFRYPRGNFTRTNAELAAILRQAPGNIAVVTMRERVRLRDGKVIGWKAVEIVVPKQ